MERVISQQNQSTKRFHSISGKNVLFIYKMALSKHISIYSVGMAIKQDYNQRLLFGGKRHGLVACKSSDLFRFSLDLISV